MTRPIIAITIGRDISGDERFLRLRRAYPAAVEAAGGAPMIVPPLEDADALRSILSTAAGVLLPGGVDVDPAHFGEQPHAATTVDELRDRLEFAVIDWALERKVPTLGICRGQQVLNVKMGGSLHQDLPELGHDHWQQTPWSEPHHPVRLASDSRLAAITGSTTLAVNSLHHQAVREPGRGLRPIGWSPDGVVEALEGTDHPWLVAVQFHPEHLLGTESSRRLLQGFVEAARQHIR
jgi:putative glutamine amidotransferase